MQLHSEWNWASGQRVFVELQAEKCCTLFIAVFSIVCIAVCGVVCIIVCGTTGIVQNLSGLSFLFLAAALSSETSRSSSALSHLFPESPFPDRPFPLNSSRPCLCWEGSVLSKLISPDDFKRFIQHAIQNISSFLLRILGYFVPLHLPSSSLFTRTAILFLFLAYLQRTQLTG